MARGTTAKEKVENKIKEAFGEDFVGIYDKKIYVWADDGGERVQIAISMTCPKTTVGTVDLTAAAGGGHDFSDPEVVVGPTTSQPAEVTPEEQKNIEDLIAALGL
jgi:hypothetical protein